MTALQQAAVGLFIQREMIDLRMFEGAEPMVFISIEADDPGVILDQLDGGYKTLAL